MTAFIGCTFTLTFAVQGAINTLGHLRGIFAAIERINSVLSTTEVDEPLAYGLEKELKLEDLKDDKPWFIYQDDYSSKMHAHNKHYMYELRSVANGCSLAWSGDICLEGKSMEDFGYHKSLYLGGLLDGRGCGGNMHRMLS